MNRARTRRWATGATAALAAASLLALADVRPVYAQGGQCTQSCHTAYAECYKRTGSNRKLCEAQLQQCLSNCINKR